MVGKDTIIKQNVMKRVLFIYGLKSLPRVFAPKLALLASLVAVTGFSVSLPNVLKNMPSLFEFQKFFEFAAAAFLNTRLAIQAIALGVLVVLFYTLRDLVKTFRHFGECSRSLNTI